MREQCCQHRGQTTKLGYFWPCFDHEKRQKNRYAAVWRNINYTYLYGLWSDAAVWRNFCWQHWMMCRLVCVFRHYFRHLKKWNLQDCQLCSHVSKFKHCMMSSLWFGVNRCSLCHCVWHIEYLRKGCNMIPLDFANQVRMALGFIHVAYNNIHVLTINPCF